MLYYISSCEYQYASKRSHFISFNQIIYYISHTTLFASKKRYSVTSQMTKINLNSVSISIQQIMT